MTLMLTHNWFIIMISYDLINILKFSDENIQYDFDKVHINKSSLEFSVLCKRARGMWDQRACETLQCRII